MTLCSAARVAVLSVSAVGLLALGGCDEEDEGAPIVIGAQWFDPEGDGTVPTALDTPVPADVVDAAGGPIALDARASLAPSTTFIEVLFDEPLAPEVIEDVVSFNGATSFVGRVDLVEIVDVPTGRRFDALAQYLNNVRVSGSFVFEDVGLRVTPVERITTASGDPGYRTLFLPSNSELQVRVFAGEIADRDGNVLQPALRRQQTETIGQVTDATGRPLAAVAVFATDSATFTSVTAPKLADVPTTLEREDAALVIFNVDVDVASASDVFTLVDTRGTPELADDAPIAVTVQARHTGDASAGAVAGDDNRVPGVLEVIPVVPLATGSYQLRVDPFYTDAFGSQTTDAPRIAPLTVK